MVLQSGLGRRRGAVAARPGRRELPDRARSVVRPGALGGAERLLALDDRRRDRRARRRPRRSRSSTAITGRRADLARHRRSVPALDQGLGGNDERPAVATSLTSSGFPRPVTRTRRSATTSATAARRSTSARSSTPASSSSSGSASCPANDPDVAATRCPSSTRRSSSRRRAGRAGCATTATATATASAARRHCTSTGRPWAPSNHGHRAPVAGAVRRARRSRNWRPGTRPAAGRRCLRAIDAMSSGVGLVPEQVWDAPDVAGVAVRHRSDHRVDRLRQRQAGRLGGAAHLGRRLAGPPDRRPDGRTVAGAPRPDGRPLHHAHRRGRPR